MRSHGTIQTQQEYLEEFLLHRKDLLASLLGSYALPTTTECQNCGIAVGRWRCRDCYLQPLLCRGCCRHRHVNLPFHRVERWTGRFFQPAHLWEVGHRLFIPHAAGICEYLVLQTRSVEEEEQKEDALEQEVLKPRVQHKGKSWEHTQRDPDMPEGQPHSFAGADQYATPVPANEGDWRTFYQWKASSSMQVDGNDDDDELPALMSVDNDSDDGEPHVSASKCVFIDIR